MYEILFSSAAERFFKKIKEKPLKNAYKEVYWKFLKTPMSVNPSMVI